MYLPNAGGKILTVKETQMITAKNYKFFKKNNPIFILCALLFLVCLSRLLTLGTYALIDPTEGRYAEIARVMVATDNWITPQIDEDVPFWGKPPLSFWATAICYRIMGHSEFATRLPSWIFGIISVFLTYLLGSALRGPVFGLCSALVLSTTGLFYVLAGGVMTDPSLATSVTLSMVGFAMSLQSSGSCPRRLWGWAFFAGLGLSLLAKGPVGLILTFLPVFIWSVCNKQLRSSLKILPWFSGVILTLLITLPWYIAAEIKTPGFLNYFIVGEHFQRFLVAGWEGDLYGNPHNHPYGMIWAFFIIATLPWSILFARTFFKKRKHPWPVKKPEETPWFSYMLFWALSPAVFFTFSKNIMITYVLPGLPGFAIAVTMILINSVHKLPKGQKPWYMNKKVLALAAFFFPVVFCCTTIPIIRNRENMKSQKNLIEWFEQKETYETAELIYLEDEVPYSAQFYSKGRAQYINKNDTHKIDEKFSDSDVDYFVVRQEIAENIPWKYLNINKKVAVFGKYILFREQQHKETDKNLNG